MNNPLDTYCEPDSDQIENDYDAIYGKHDHIFNDVYHDCDTDKFFRYSIEAEGFKELLELEEVFQTLIDLADHSKGGE